jgi:hypothetical protein
VIVPGRRRGGPSRGRRLLVPREEAFDEPEAVKPAPEGEGVAEVARPTMDRVRCQAGTPGATPAQPARPSAPAHRARRA